MYIDLRCGYTFMPEHLLYGSEIGAPLKQVCGKGMPQCVWRDGFSNPGHCSQLPDDIENHDSCQPSSATVQEEYMVLPGLNRQGISVGKISLYRINSRLVDRHYTLLVALPGDNYELFIEIDLRELKPDELRHPETASVERLDDSPVACAFSSRHVYSLNHHINLIDSQHLRQSTAKARTFQ